MSDFVNRLLGAGGPDGPPVRPLIGSLFEPRRRMQVWPPQSDLPMFPAELEVEDRNPPIGGQELPAAEPSDSPPPPLDPAELAATERASAPPQAVRAEPPAGPGRPAEPPAAFALPKPRRAGTPPGEPTLEAPEKAPEEEHATPEEAAPAPDPVRAHPAPPSAIDTALADPLLAPRRERATAAPNVRITIGRIEVRAGRQPPVPQPPRRIPGRRPAMSLEDYLRTRSEGGGAR